MFSFSCRQVVWYLTWVSDYVVTILRSADMYVMKMLSFYQYLLIFVTESYVWKETIKVQFNIRTTVTNVVNDIENEIGENKYVKNN